MSPRPRAWSARVGPVTLTAVLLWVASLFAATPTTAATTAEVEPNNSRAQAQVLELPIDLWNPFIGTVNAPGDVDWYAFDVPARHAIKVSVDTHGAKRFVPSMTLRAPSGAVMEGRESNGSDLTGYGASAGRYYLKLAHASATASGQQYSLELVTYSYPGEPSAWSPTPMFPTQRYAMAPVDPPTPNSLEVADVTGDGRGDVLATVLTADGPALYVFPARVGGWLGKPSRWVLPPSDGPWDGALGVTAGDLIGDARADVAMGVVQGVQLFEQRDAGLVRAGLVETPYIVHTIAIVDANLDGRRDLVANTSRGILVILRTASGFAAPKRVITTSSNQLRVADVVGSTRPDLVTIRDDGYVRIYRQQSDGTFAPPTLLIPRHDDYQSLDGLVVADLIGDARPEIAVQADGYLNVFSATSSGWSTPRVSLAPGHPPKDAADINDDGRNELISETHIIFLDASGVRRRQVMHNSDTNPRGPDSLAVGDVSADGSPDVVGVGNDGPDLARSGFSP